MVAVKCSVVSSGVALCDAPLTCSATALVTASQFMGSVRSDSKEAGLLQNLLVVGLTDPKNGCNMIFSVGNPRINLPLKWMPPPIYGDFGDGLLLDLPHSFFVEFKLTLDASPDGFHLMRIEHHDGHSRPLVQHKAPPLTTISCACLGEYEKYAMVNFGKLSIQPYIYIYTRIYIYITCNYI